MLFLKIELWTLIVLCACVRSIAQTRQMTDNKVVTMRFSIYFFSFLLLLFLYKMLFELFMPGQFGNPSILQCCRCGRQVLWHFPHTNGTTAVDWKWMYLYAMHCSWKLNWQMQIAKQKISFFFRYLCSSDSCRLMSICVAQAATNGNVKN